MGSATAAGIRPRVAPGRATRSTATSPTTAIAAQNDSRTQNAGDCKSPRRFGLRRYMAKREAQGKKYAQSQHSDRFTPHAPRVHWVEAVGEERNQFICIHVRIRIRPASAFRPRCMPTFTADSDMPTRTAVCATLSPCIFTYNIDIRCRSGS